MWAASGWAVAWGTALQANKVVGSIPDGVIEIFHWHNPSGSAMALGSTQPPSKGGRRVRLTTLQPTYDDCLKIICCFVWFVKWYTWIWESQSDKKNWYNLHT
jgi:hypothetical protein